MNFSLSLIVFLCIRIILNSWIEAFILNENIILYVFLFCLKLLKKVFDAANGLKEIYLIAADFHEERYWKQYPKMRKPWNRGWKKKSARKPKFGLLVFNQVCSFVAVPFYVICFSRPPIDISAHPMFIFLMTFSSYN